MAAKKSWWQTLGPGFVTGASDDDPSGIGTYAAAGAAYGYTTLWLAWITFPLMAGTQLICAKLGHVTGRGLAGILHEHYPRWVGTLAVLLLLVANTINAGADLGAISAALAMVTPIPPLLSLVPISLGLLALQVYGNYHQIERVFKLLALALLGYIAAAFLAHPDWGAVLRASLRPTIAYNGKFLATVVAILGTTISPYLFFWQARAEVEDPDADMQERTTDINIGMGLSNAVMFFIILATAATLHQAGQTEVTSATQAAEALVPFAGRWATALFAVGLIGTGVLAVPILVASSSYALCDVFGWPCGLDKRAGEARGFYAIIAASMAIALGVNYVGWNPMDLLFWTAVINGLLAPPLLVMIMLAANNPAVMGQERPSRVLNLLGWATTVAMSVAAIALVVTSFVPGASHG